MGQSTKIVTREVVYYILSGTPRAPQKCFRSNLRVEFLGKNHFFLFEVPNQTLWISHVISTTLKAGLGVLPVLLILGLREYSRKCYTTFCGSTPTKVL